MRLLALVLFGLPLAVATIVEAERGNPFAIGIALGLVGPAVYFATVALLTRAATPPPLKADPAKIRQMEHELGIEAQHDPLTCAFCRVAEKAAAHSRRTDDAPTTVATFHGAPTFGHKIEGP